MYSRVEMQPKSGVVCAVVVSLDQTIEAKANKHIPNANMPVCLFTKNNLIFTKLTGGTFFMSLNTHGERKHMVSPAPTCINISKKMIL